MKSVLSFIAVFLLFTGLNAQMTEGHIAYSVEFSSKDPDFQMYSAMMQGSKLDIYFAKGKSRTEMKIGTLMETTVVIEDATKEMLTLMSGMVGKKAIKGKVEEDQIKEEQPKFTVELINETKKISDYTCKKAIVTDEEGSKYTFWYTEEIKINTKGQKYFDGYGIPGFPMQMEIQQNGMDIKMVATAVEKALPKKHTLFSMAVPEGYEVVTEEQMGEMMGGMK